MQASRVPQYGPSWEGKRVLVVGLARSGLAAAGLLLAAGARPRLHDRNAQELNTKAVHELVQAGCEVAADAHPERLLKHMDAVVVSPGVPVSAPVVVLAAQRGIPVLGELELGARFACGPLFAITGTNGKTTTVTLLGEMLRQAGMVAHVAGNIGYPLSAAVLTAGKEDVFVAEVSSFQLETSQLFHPHISAVLNLTPDHLNRHGNMEKYALLKRSIAANQQAADFAVLNWDDGHTRSMAEHIPSQVFWFSRLQSVPRGTFVEDGSLVFTDGDLRKPICAAQDVSLPGEHNLENALAAACIAMLANVPAAVIRHTLRTFSGVEHRLEFVLETNGIRYVNDSKGTNPDATMRAIGSMQTPFVLLAGGQDKGTDFRELACAAAQNPLMRGVIFFGETARQMQQAFLSAGCANATLADTLEQALLKANGMAEPGYSILLSPACASFDQFDSYEHRGTVFKQLVAGLVEEGKA